jgi:MFS family permease
MKLFEGISRNVFVLGAVSFLTDVSSEMVFPILPLFLANFLGAGKEIIGLIEGVADSIASLMDIFFGYWSDRSGRRKDFVVAGYGLSSALKAALVFASSWQQVFVIRGGERIGKSLRTSPRDAIIASSSAEKNRGRAFGFHRAMDTLGAIIGPVVALSVFSYLGENEPAFRAIFMIALVPAFLAVVAIAFFVKEPKAARAAVGRKPRFWEALRMLDSRYRAFLGVSCLFSLAYFSFALLIVRAGEIGLGVEDALVAYIVFNGVYFLASMPIGILSDKAGRKPVIAAAFMLYALICVGFIGASELWHIVALFAAYGIFVAADESVNKAYISDIAGDRTRGIALGAYNSAVGAAYLPANALFGIVWAAFGAPAAFGAAAAVALAAGALMLRIR